MHKLYLKKCRVCGKEKMMRKSVTLCSLSCAGKLAGKAKIGTKWSDESKLTHSEGRKKFYQENPDKITKLYGDENPAYRDGNGIKYINFTSSLKKEIRKRDNYTCQFCGRKWNENEYKFAVHHVDCDKSNFNKKNLITLCKSCHSRWHRLN